MAVFSEEFLSENDSEAVLVTFCCYDCGVNASQAVKKIRLLKISKVDQIKNIIANTQSIS